MGCSIIREGLAAFHSETTEKSVVLQSGVYAIYTAYASIGKWRHYCIYIHICVIPSPSLSSLLPSAQPPSTVSVSDAATSITLPPLTPPAPDTASESVIELQCALLHIQLILVLSLSPLATAIIKALNHQLDAKWSHFGIFLGIDYQLMETIETRKRGNPEDCMLDLLGKWTSNQARTGARPRTWKTVVEAVKETGFGAIADVLALKHGVNLPQ